LWRVEAGLIVVLMLHVSDDGWDAHKGETEQQWSKKQRLFGYWPRRNR
jgi:hypothetical protein